MGKKITWTKSAVNDYKEIIEFYQIFSDKYADNILNKMSKNVIFLSENPFLGNATSYDNLRIKIVLKRFSIIYKYFPVSKEIIIYRIWDNRRNPIAKFKNL